MSKLDFDEYQRLAARTAEYSGRDGDHPTMYPFLGLPGEAGEVCEQIKKAVRDDDGMITAERCEAIAKELGDVLWYVAAICDELGLEMSDVAWRNVEKLADRQDRGVIRGEGDER